MLLSIHESEWKSNITTDTALFKACDACCQQSCFDTRKVPEKWNYNEQVLQSIWTEILSINRPKKKKLNLLKQNR